MISQREDLGPGGGGDGRPGVLVPAREADQLHVLEAALQASANGVVICDHQGLIVWVNRAFTELTGYTAPEVLGRTPRLLKSGRHDTAFYQNLWNTILSGNVWRGEIENRRKDGTVYPEEMTITPVLGAGGEIRNFIAIKQNVADRKAAESALAKSEARFRNLANCMPEFVVETDLAGTITYANSNGRELLGRRGKALDAGVRLTDPLVPGDRDRALADFRRLLGGQALAQYEYRALREDGSTFPILISPSLIVEDDRTVGIRAIAVDMTERDKAEEALRLAQFAIDNAADGIVWVDSSGKILYVNHAFCRMHGYTRDELLSMTIDRVRPDLSPESWQRSWELGKGRTIGFEASHRRKNGTIFPVDIKATQAEFRGKEYGFAFVHDITVEKLADEELAKVNHLFETLMAATPDRIYFKDRDSRFLRISKAQATMFGLSYPSQAIGKTDSEFFSAEHAQKAYRDEQEIIKTGKSLMGMEEKETWPGGRVTWASTNKARFCGPDGQVIGTFGISRDITARKAAEEHLRASEEFTERVIESWPDGVGVIKTDGTLLYLSANGRRLLELRQDVDVSPLNWLDFWEGAERRKAQDGLQKAIDGGLGAYEGSFGAAKGAPKLRDVTISPIRRANGEVERLVCVFRDITERRLLESQLAQAQKLESIGQLAAGIAHEINTPIQYIGDNGRFLEEAFRDLLRAIPPPDGDGESPASPGNGVDLDYLRVEIPQAIQQLLEGVDHVARIVRAMKEFSHPGGAEKTLVDVNHAIESTALVSRNEWKYVAGLTLDLDPHLPLVSCFVGELNQVLLNLIVNSAQAIAAAGDSGRKGSIHVATRRNGGWVEIEVSDNGPGIPEEIQSKVFDPFFTTKPVGKGTGQGLAIAHSVIVKKHQGSIGLESSPTTGTRFLIRLPLITEARMP